MVPTPRLIWAVAAVGFPATLALALFPVARVPAIATMAVLVLLAFIDALHRNDALSGLRVQLPELVRGVEGREVILPVLIHNAEAKPRSLRLALAFPDGVSSASEEKLIRLPANTEAVRLLWPCTPDRRGRNVVDSCYLEAASPLGLWTVRRRDPVALELRAYPNLREDAALIAPRRGQVGVHSLRQVGKGREFERLREYQPGDGAEDIHWKATARRGRPVTKVFQVERTQEVYVILDTSRLSGRFSGNQTNLDRAIKAALLTGAAVENHGDLFGLAAFSDQVETFVRARAGKTHYAACRDAIYQLRPRSVSPDFDEIATLLRLRLRRRSLLIFLTALDDPLSAENFTRATRLLASHHLVVAGMLRPAGANQIFTDQNVETSHDIYQQLAGHLAWRKLRELEGTLSRQGVRMTLFAPDKFASSLIGLYDEIKQRQLV
jgi:uncharacterized protein (DUF58 family)